MSNNNITAKKWRVEYDNEVGQDDEGFGEWWEVTDGDKSFKSTNEKGANWLADILNTAEDVVSQYAKVKKLLE